MSDISHPIIALWCHPRTRSTALERLMIERGDLAVLHEPFSYLYYVHQERSSITHLHEDTNQPRSYSEIREHLLAAGERGPVLFKDMAYHCLEELLEDETLLKRLRHAFLIRDPALSIASHYALDPECSLEEVGVEQLCLLFRKVCSLKERTPPVIDAEALAQWPQQIVSQLLAELKLPTIKSALGWQSGHRKEWDTWKEWHAAASASTGIHDATRVYETTVENDETLRRFYLHHLPYYTELRGFALSGTDIE